MTTDDLIAQYDAAVSPWDQQRVNIIVDLLADRADEGDGRADDWLRGR